MVPAVPVVAECDGTGEGPVAEGGEPDDEGGERPCIVDADTISWPRFDKWARYSVDRW